MSSMVEAERGRAATARRTRTGLARGLAVGMRHDVGRTVPATTRYLHLGVALEADRMTWGPRRRRRDGRLHLFASATNRTFNCSAPGGPDDEVSDHGRHLSGARIALCRFDDSARSA